MNYPQVQFEWDETKAATNLKKHGISFELAVSVFNDPFILTIADIDHSQAEERWFSIGLASNGVLLALAYLWSENEFHSITIRLITARKATTTEVGYYKDNQ